jgi:hypothetical protein
MKKLNLFIFSIFCATSLLFAQVPTSGGPDAFGYTFKTSQDPTGPSYSWFDISQIGTTVSGLADDNFVGPFPISNFPFYSSTPQSLYIGSNGYVAFSPGNIASTAAQFPAIPNSGGSNNFIAAMLTDLNFSGPNNPANAYFYSAGDTVCITFEKVPFWTNNAVTYSGLNTFQVILNKADSSITVNYKLQSGLPDPTYVNNFVSMGIENSTGLDGLQFWRSNTFPPDTFSVKYYYPSVTAPVTDLSLNWTSNENNGGKFLLVNQTFNPILNILNVGNQDIRTNITVNYELRDATNLLVTSGSGSIDSLLVGDDSSYVFTATPPITFPGRYRLKTFLSAVSGDNIQLNDTSEALVKVLDSSKFPVILDYSDIATPSFGGVSWSGGNAGVGVYIEPPFYPARIVASNFYIANTGTTGFYSILYDDDARGGGPGTVLDSTYFGPGQIASGQYIRDSLRNNVIINSGGVYLLWLMGNGTITLGTSFAQPVSKQTFEVIGGAWAPYRSREFQDFKMNIEVQPLSVSLNEVVEDLPTKLNIYPNPSNNFFDVEGLENIDQQTLELFDLQGKRVHVKIIPYDKKVRVFKGALDAGQYFIRINQETKPIIFTD